MWACSNRGRAYTHGQLPRLCSVLVARVAIVAGPRPSQNIHLLGGFLSKLSEQPLLCLCLLIQAEEDEEMPEQMLACAYVSRLSSAACPPVPVRDQVCLPSPAMTDNSWARTEGAEKTGGRCRRRRRHEARGSGDDRTRSSWRSARLSRIGTCAALRRLLLMPFSLLPEARTSDGCPAPGAPGPCPWGWPLVL